MSKINLFEDLKNNSYPGRGIVIGTSPDGKSAVTAYFIMGRSENSRNRIFTLTDDGIRTQAFDESSKTRTLSYMRRFVFSETRRLLQTATRPTRYMTLWTNK
mgnify:CR=1 FL=1